jgi:hypothetical protein
MLRTELLNTILINFMLQEVYISFVIHYELIYPVYEASGVAITLNNCFQPIFWHDFCFPQSIQTNSKQCLEIYYCHVLPDQWKFTIHDCVIKPVQ